MFFIYLVMGCVVIASYDVMPIDVLRQIHDSDSRPPSGTAVLLAVAAWCLALAVWPVTVCWRAAAAVQKRLTAALVCDCESQEISAPRHPSGPITSIPSPRQPQP
ncbi:hypothetical protein ACFRKB_32070 [Streptomyces scopuliridis]|uniref:hypothetical protein n=1 Tax=Streptomyces scopuliridis TaxID=452529 RepID=UPI0036AD3C34